MISACFEESKKKLNEVMTLHFIELMHVLRFA